MTQQEIDKLWDLHWDWAREGYYRGYNSDTNMVNCCQAMLELPNLLLELEESKAVEG